MYAGLFDLLDVAKTKQMHTLVVTNGTLLDRRRVYELRERVDLLAISLDGRPQLHNNIRQSPRAFEVMTAQLENVRAAGIPFGLVFTLSRDSFDDLIWAADFAVEQGAQLLHVHPLAEVGRAAISLTDRSLRPGEMTVAWLAALHLAEAYKEKLTIHIDLVEASTIATDTGELLGPKEPEHFAESALGTLVSPLIIEEDGTVVPFAYGMDRVYALGSIATDSLSDLARRWRTSPHGYVALRASCAQLQQVLAHRSPAVIDWYRELARLRRWHV
jgi:MoaA/NifB/PqqE/SkfB family radical SAM enzyme